MTPMKTLIKKSPIKLKWRHMLDETIEGELYANLPLRIGRGHHNDVVLHDNLKSVSRSHAVVSKEGDGIIIRDLRSMNGILFGGRILSQAMLTDSAQFVLGAFIVTMHLSPQKRPSCSNPTCGREVNHEVKMCPWCGRFMADAVTKQGLFT